MDFEEILNTIGDYGPYQKKLLYLVLIPYSLFLPWAHSSTMFMVTTPRHGCRVPELKNFSIDQQFMITAPETIESPRTSICSILKTNYTKLINDLQLDRIDKNDANKFREKLKNYFYSQNKSPNGQLKLEYQNYEYKSCDQGFIYDDKDYDETAVTAFDLVCEKEYLANHVLSSCGLGSILGTPLFGAMSDKLGRKKTMLVVNIIFILGTFSPTLYKDYYGFLVSRFLISSVINTQFQIPFILTTELVGPDERTKLGFATSIAWGVGICILPIYAYLFRNWVYMNHIITLTGVFYLLSYLWILESPRWLLASSKLKEAEKVLKKIAKANKVPDAEKTMFVQRLEMIAGNETEPDKESSSLILFTNPKIRSLFINITLGYIANSIAYNAINLNTFSLSGNQFLNYFLLSFIEIPASYVAYLMMETALGRRWTGSLFLLIFAVLNWISIMIENSYIIITMNVIGKLLMVISFTAIYQISVEIYPTQLRNQGLSLSLTIASIQSIILPHFIKRNQSGDNFLTLALITVLCFASGIFFTFIPETLHQKLPQSIYDAEVFGEDKKFWSLAKPRKASIRRNSNMNNNNNTTLSFRNHTGKSTPDKEVENELTVDYTDKHKNNSKSQKS